MRVSEPTLGGVLECVCVTVKLALAVCRMYSVGVVVCFEREPEVDLC